MGFDERKTEREYDVGERRRIGSVEYRWGEVCGAEWEYDRCIRDCKFLWFTLVHLLIIDPQLSLEYDSHPNDPTYIENSRCPIRPTPFFI